MAGKEEKRARVELQIIDKPQEHSYKEQDGEVNHSPANSANGDETDVVEQLFQEKVLGCLHRSTRPRKWAINVLLWPYLFMLLSFQYNSVAYLLMLRTNDLHVAGSKGLSKSH